MGNEDRSTKSLAVATLKVINTFVQEFDGSLLKPNVVFLNLTHYNALAECFPYLIKALTLVYNEAEYKIVITKDTSVGMAYAYLTDQVLEYNNL